MPEGTRWTTPEGGYQVWVELPGAIDTRDLLADAVARGRALRARARSSTHDGRPSRGLRLSFAMAAADALRRGVARLARLVRDAASPASRRRPRRPRLDSEGSTMSEVRR